MDVAPGKKPAPGVKGLSELSLFSTSTHGTAALAYGARPRRPRNPQGAAAAATPPPAPHTPLTPPPKGDVFSLGSCPRIPRSGAAVHLSPTLKTDPTTGAGEHAWLSRCFFPPPTPGLCSRPVAGKVPVDGWPTAPLRSPLSLSLSASRRVLAAPPPSAVGSAPPSRARRTCSTPLVLGICGCEARRELQWWFFCGVTSQC